jgi:hypothetical protein
MNKSIEEKIAALQKQIEELKLESEEGYAKTVIEAGPILVAQKAEVTIPFRFRIIEMPKLADYGLPYSKVKGDIDTSKVEPKEIDGGIVVSAADKNWAVYEMMLLPTVDDSTRIFKIKGLQCTIENPIKNQYKKISLTVNKNVDEEFLLVFYKKNMSHVLCFQGLLDFLTGKPDENDVFHLICDAQGPKEYTILRLVEPARFVEK